MVDLAADVAGLEDKQTVQVDLKESNLAALYEIDHDAWCAAVRARANTLRARAREFQLGALPTDQGRDPGPLSSRSPRRRAATGESSAALTHARVFSILRVQARRGDTTCRIGH